MKRVRRSPSRLASYLVPDLVIYGDGGKFSGQRDVLDNRIVIFEVLTPSTFNFGHGRKWKRYRDIDSLMHYVMIERNEPRIEVNEHSWQYGTIAGLEAVIDLVHLDVKIPLTAVYERVTFPS